MRFIFPNKDKTSALLYVSVHQKRHVSSREKN